MFIKAFQLSSLAMSIAALIGATLAAQGQRVATFKAWDSALAQYLKDGNVSAYRHQVLATRAFFGVRQTLNCIVSVRKKHRAVQGVQRSGQKMRLRIARLIARIRR